MASLPRLYFVTMDGASIGHVEQVAAACAAGIRWIQLRMKEAPDEEVRGVAVAARKCCEEHGAVLILDDRVELAAETGVDGVHVGLQDMPIAEARRILGPGRIIGGTANTIEAIREHCLAGADYIGLGPYRYTTTKKKLSPVLGLEGYRRIMAEPIDVPVVAIGGIEAGDVLPLLEAGVHGVAFSGMLVHAGDRAALVKELTNKIHDYAHYSG